MIKVYAITVGSYKKQFKGTHMSRGSVMDDIRQLQRILVHDHGAQQREFADWAVLCRHLEVVFLAKCQEVLYRCETAHAISHLSPPAYPWLSLRAIQAHLK